MAGRRLCTARLIGDLELHRAALPGAPPIASRPAAPRQSTVVPGVRRLEAQRSNGRYIFRARREAEGPRA